MKGTYASQHLVIVHCAHPVTRLIIHTEHFSLLHAGPILCTGWTLPHHRWSESSSLRDLCLYYKPTIAKAYACVFFPFLCVVKAIHIKVVSDLSTTAFIASLRRFIARRGKPTLLWSDNGTNFVGASRALNMLKELFEFITQQKTQKVMSEFCSTQHIQWKLIPSHAPHFGGLWEAAVHSMKLHLRRIVSEVKLTFEELTAVLAQVEACLNSRPLVALPADDDGIDALTPGHFLIGRPLEALPDPPDARKSLPLLHRWHLCQGIIKHFWKHWSGEYLVSLLKSHKWHQRSRNLAC